MRPDQHEVSAVALRFCVIGFLNAGGVAPWFYGCEGVVIFGSGPPLERGQLAIHAQREMGQGTWCMFQR